MTTTNSFYFWMMTFSRKRMKKVWKEFNENPTGRQVGDCSVRAIQKALGVSWERAYVLLCVNGFLMGDLPNSNSVWGAVLRQNGFKARTIPDTCPECYTADDFCDDNREGTFVLGFGNHVATVVDGTLYDAWDSSQEIPQYVWYKEDIKDAV